MIQISITEEDAELFKMFRKHQAVFKQLIEAGFEDTYNGKMILNFNYLGKLCDVEKQVHIKIV